MEDFKGDKRSKAYRKYKKNFEKQSNGLGDKVENIFKKTGIAKVAKFILGEDCGCRARKNTLNKMFPSKKINCLTEKEYNHLDNYFNNPPPNIKPTVQFELVVIYNRVFNDRASPTGCSSCFLNGVHAKLKQVFEQYSQ